MRKNKYAPVEWSHLMFSKIHRKIITTIMMMSLFYFSGFAGLRIRLFFNIFDLLNCLTKNEITCKKSIELIKNTY